MIHFEIAAFATTGDREYQEDSWTVRSMRGDTLDERAAGDTGVRVTGADGLLVILADGVGGRPGGDEASKLVTKHGAEAFLASTGDPVERLKGLANAANDAVGRVNQNRPSSKRMASTLIAATLTSGKPGQPGRMDFVSVGDSLILRIREEEVHKVNASHKHAVQIDRAAVLSGSEEQWQLALSDADRGSISSAIVGNPIRLMQAAADRRIYPDDVLIFASDGLETLSTEHLRVLVPDLLSRGGVVRVAQGLVQAAERIGRGHHQDNTTIVVVRAVNGAADPAQVAQAPQVPQTERLDTPRPQAPPQQRAAPPRPAPASATTPLAPPGPPLPPAAPGPQASPQAAPAPGSPQRGPANADIATKRLGPVPAAGMATSKKLILAAVAGLALVGAAVAGIQFGVLKLPWASDNKVQVPTSAPAPLGGGSESPDKNRSGIGGPDGPTRSPSPGTPPETGPSQPPPAPKQVTPPRDTTAAPRRDLPRDPPAARPPPNDGGPRPPPAERGGSLEPNERRGDTQPVLKIPTQPAVRPGRPQSDTGLGSPRQLEEGQDPTPRTQLPRFNSPPLAERPEQRSEAPQAPEVGEQRERENEGRVIETGALAALEPVCRPFQEALQWDSDGDFQRNAAVLDNEQMSICRVAFQEAGVSWSLQIIRKRTAKGTYVPGPLWVVPHDNENAAFGSALHGLKGYGGTVVAVETGGQRLNAGVDPNRNFSFGRPCAGSARASALYTREVLRWRTEGMPVIALHTNDPGWAGDGSGQGHVSMKNRSLGNPLRGVPSILRFRNDDTMVFVASRLPLSANQTTLAQDISYLRSNGIHVIYEHVTAQKNDCSLSNYAALRGIQGYFNIEVAHGDGGTQRAILDILLPRLLAPRRDTALDSPRLVKIIEESQAPSRPQVQPQVRNLQPAEAQPPRRRLPQDQSPQRPATKGAEP